MVNDFFKGFLKSTGISFLIMMVSLFVIWYFAWLSDLYAIVAFAFMLVVLAYFQRRIFIKSGSKGFRKGVIVALITIILLLALFLVIA